MRTATTAGSVSTAWRRMLRKCSVPGIRPDLGDVGARGLEEVQREGEEHARRHPRLDAHQQRQDDGGGDGGEVGARVGPGAAQHAEVDERQHRDDDGGGERRLRQEAQERRERERRDEQARGGEGAGGGRRGARVEVDDRAGEAARDRHPPGEGRAEVGRAEADQLLVGVDALALLGGEGAGDRDRLHEADHRDQEGGQREGCAASAGVERRQGQGRQAARHLAHEAHAPVGEAEAPRRAAW